MSPFRDLLKTKGNSKFYWDEILDRLFQHSKDVIAQRVADGVRAFEVNRPSCLSTDWSRNGIGFILQQKHCQCSMEKAVVDQIIGNWYSPGVVSPPMPSPGTLRLKVKLSLSSMDSSSAVCSC